MSLINRFNSEQGKILSKQINRLTLKQQRFIRKEGKIGKKGINFFYLSKEHHQQLFYMQPLLILEYQQRFYI
jgi:hypothetical protein